MRTKLAGLIILYLAIAFGENLLANEVPKYGPMGAPYAVPLSQDHRYFQDSKNMAFDYWNLAPFYVPQINELSCSVASVTMVLNGIIRAAPETSA